MTDISKQNNTIEHREYNLKVEEEDDHNLRIEIDQEYMHFILSKLNQPLEYTYKNKIDLLTIVNKLELNSSKYTNLELVLNIFDTLYEKNKILIDINDENSCNLLVKIKNIFEEEEVKEIKLYKEYMSNNDKFNLLYNKIKLLNNSNHSSEDNTEFESKKEEKKDILNKKNNIIKEIKEKLLKQENEIKKVSKENINEIINKKIEEIENKLVNKLNEKIDVIKNKLINDINKQNELIKKYKENNIDNSKIKKIEEKYNKLIENLDFMREIGKSEEKGNKKEGEMKINEFLYKNNDIKNIIKDNELIKKEIKEINNKINNNDKEIIKIENLIKENEVIINNLKEKLNVDNNLIQINKKLDETNKIKKKEKDMIKTENSINIKLEEKKKDINNKIENKFDNNKLKEIYENINNKYNELKEKIKHNEYINKINYQFIKDPINLQYKLDISFSNTNAGWNDMFEVFLSYKDNKEYIASPNINNYNLDIYELIDNKKVLSLRGHKNDVRTVRYFINKKDYKEYLISADDNKIVIIWEISDNYNIKHQIDTKYGNNIYSCLLVFPHNNENNYIITSSYNDSDNLESSATKIYSFSNGRFMRYINDTNNNVIYYLLTWYNKKNNRYFIIQFSYLKIIINDLFDNEIFYELIKEPETDHFSGFIYTKNNIDYLCSSSENGYINIWDLYSKKIFKVINTNNCLLAHIIQWNDNYVLVADFNHKSFIIVDLEEDEIISIYNIQHTKEVKCIKKINHPIYGESLLSCSKDNTIKLWII